MEIKGRSWPFYTGEVILTDLMGGDLSVANSARVSFNQKSEVLTDKDKKLIKYLSDHLHMSPFRHCSLQLTFQKIPEVLARQAFKHITGFGITSQEFRESATVWNEISGRYVELPTEFFTPKSFRKQSKNNKQASDPETLVEDQEKALSIYRNAQDQLGEAYRSLLALGVCKEQARFLLPMSFLTSWVWTGSLEAFVHFVRLRNHPGAQYEMVELARIVEEIVRLVAPVSTTALLGESK